jgi:hypothetical protein
VVLGCRHALTILVTTWSSRVKSRIRVLYGVAWIGAQCACIFPGGKSRSGFNLFQSSETAKPGDMGHEVRRPGFGGNLSSGSGKPRLAVLHSIYYRFFDVRNLVEMAQ